jgi:hypothetical protein
MAKKVADNDENMEICKKFCGPCLTFKPNSLNEVEPHALFCARGASQKPKSEIKENGCNCFKCGVFKNYNLKGGYFCIFGVEGKK